MGIAPLHRVVDIEEDETVTLAANIEVRADGAHPRKITIRL